MKRDVCFRVHASGGVVLWGNTVVTMGINDKQHEEISMDMEGPRGEVDWYLVMECPLEFLFPVTLYKAIDRERAWLDLSGVDRSSNSDLAGTWCAVSVVYFRKC